MVCRDGLTDPRHMLPTFIQENAVFQVYMNLKQTSDKLKEKHE